MADCAARLATKLGLVDDDARVGDIADRLLHIEFQSGTDYAFTFRMLGYYGEILERLAADRRSRREVAPFETEVHQILMYIGNGHWPQPSSIRHPNLSFKFEVVNSVDV